MSPLEFLQPAADAPAKRAESPAPAIVVCALTNEGMLVRRCVTLSESLRTTRRQQLAEITFTGGGGTDFTPLLEEAGRHRPDLIVVLTDLQGPARQRPRAPVLWTVPEAHAAAVQPLGRKLVQG